VKKILLTLLILIFSLEGIGQISYRTRYRKAVFIETFAVSPIFSLNVDHAVNRRKNSFTDIRYGIGFVPGSKKRDKFGWSDNGLSVPMSVTQNFLVNNLKRRILQRVSLKCKSRPSKISVESFLEVGAAYTPVFYGISKPRHNFSGIIGLRQQVVFDIPPKPKVIFFKVQYTPKYYRGSLSWNPITGSTNIFGMSLGFSI
jgi:hypothetical protein